MMYQKRKEPTRFPYTTPVNLPTGVSDCRIEFPATFKSAESFVAFKMNYKNLDAIALRDRAKEARDAGLTVDDIRVSLKTDAVFVERKELEPDGEGAFTCIRCMKQYQPLLKPMKSGGVMGNFRTLRVKEVSEFDSQRQAITDGVTKWFLGLEDEAQLPTHETVVAPYCTPCRDQELDKLHREKTRLEREHEQEVAAGNVNYVLRVPFIPRFFRIDDVVDALNARESVIANTINQKRFDAVVTKLSSGGNTRRPAANGGYRGNTGRGDRPRGERKAWIKTTVGATVHSFELYPQVTDTLDRLVTEGKIEKSLQALLDVTPSELEAMGVEGSAKIQELAQKHLDFLEREANKASVAGRGAVTLGEVAQAHRR